MRTRLKKPGGEIKFVMPKIMDCAWLEQHHKELLSLRADCFLDFTNTTSIDSAGRAYIRVLHTCYKSAGKRLVLQHIRSEHLGSLQEWPEEEGTGGRERAAPFVLRIGTMAVHYYQQVLLALSVLAEMLYWGTFGFLKKQEVKRGAFGEQMFQLGYRAVGIVGLLSFLIGMVLSLQTAIQLRTYGAGIFLAPLIGITMVREMGPLLTAIILAGRTGSATTAEIATMGVNEEIDALKTMGINPIQFIVVPKFWAISITMPLLSIIATTAGIVGGYCIAMIYLDLSAGLFFGELSKYLTINDIRAGFVKSMVFSWLIVWVGSFYGLRVRGGAEAVGKETTGSVVTGIFIIIIADALFSFIL